SGGRKPAQQHGPALREPRDPEGGMDREAESRDPQSRPDHGGSRRVRLLRARSRPRSDTHTLPERPGPLHHVRRGVRPAGKAPEHVVPPPFPDRQGPIRRPTGGEARPAYDVSRRPGAWRGPRRLDRARQPFGSAGGRCHERGTGGLRARHRRGVGERSRGDPRQTNDTSYPTDTEIVLEGKILQDETTTEGPFVDLTNTYDVVRVQPVFVIDKIVMRRNAVYHALLPGGTEHRLLMGAPRTPTIYKALKEAGVDVTNVYLTEGGSGWLDAVVAIRKKSDADARIAIDAAIRGHRSLKKITIVDSDVDVTNPNEVNYAITMYWDAGKEVVMKGVKGSSLDPMATPDGIGSKLA